MSVSFEFDEAEIELMIFRAISDKFNVVLPKLSNILLEESRLIVRDAITASPEYNALLGNGIVDLQAHFGLIAPTTVVNDIVYRILDEMSTETEKIKISKGSIVGGLSLNILRKDFSEALAADKASYLSNGHNVDWLRWLLLAGTSDVVIGYNIEFGPFAQSRSRKAIMVEAHSNYHVPQSVAGQSEDNWLTRAIANIQGKLTRIIEVQFRKLL